MLQFFEYYGKFQGLRGNVTGLPTWARYVLTIVAIPGIVLIALSILAFLVSLLALLLVTVPVYRLLRAITVRPALSSYSPADVTEVPQSPADEPRTGRRHIDVKIVE